MLRSFLISITAIFLLACSDAEQLSKVEVEIREIAWEDLMPAGEEERLADLYTNYYTALENQLLQDTQQQDTEGGLNLDNITEGSANDTMEQIGTFNVVESLNGENIRIPGYVVPLDFNAESRYKEFLLVPYFGACLHTPPPPPNQIIYVTANPAVEVESIYSPVWLEGKIKTGEFSSELADTAYEVKLSNLELYVY